MTTTFDTRDKYCIVGAGPSGLTVAKNFKQREIPFDWFEREDDFGGNWYYGRPSSSVYASTHLISSKRLTEYTDFPMPAEYPPYPSHRQVLEYLREYARHFGLYDCVRFGSTVQCIEPAGDAWHVRLCGQDQPRQYRGVVIANGHHWDPLLPTYQGRFDGLVLHSRDYKTPDVLRGRRVLVVGAGNSGCDIAVEAAQNAASTLISMRRGYHFLPKFLLGKPVDLAGERLHRWRLPLWLRRRIASAVSHVAIGSPRRFGLPEPDHKLFESHPIVNSQLLYYVGHGDISVRPDIERLDGNSVCFTDGSRDEVDVIVYATGYHLSFPFIDEAHLNWSDGRPQLFLNAFHPQRDDLFVAGLIQPNSGQWGLTDLQAQLIASFIVAVERDPKRADNFRRLKAQPTTDLSHGLHYVKSKRHVLEVEYFSYRQRLRKLLKKFGSAPGQSMATHRRLPS